MSRTYNEHRNNVGLYKANKGKRGIVDKKIKFNKRKMTPMLAGKRGNYGKWSYADGIDVIYCYKTKAMKLELKNANRSVKKADRHRAKKQILQEIQNIKNATTI